MGIKSTIYLDRKGAELKLASYLRDSNLSTNEILEILTEYITTRNYAIQAVVASVSNEVLGDLLDEYTDSKFENYLVDD